MLFKLTRKVEPLAPTHSLDVKHEEVDRTDTLPVTEVSPVKKKYLVAVEVGDMPPVQAIPYLKQSHERLKEFFGDNVMVVPVRNGQPSIGIYEVEPFNEEPSDASGHD